MKISDVTETTRIETIDLLRGLASLAVCWFHFGLDTKIVTDPFLQLSGKYGFLGVQVFFVISGFVIPWSLARSGYKRSDYFRFISKRVLRLDPPYLMSIIVAIVIGGGYAWYQGLDYQIDKTALLLHIGYLNTFFEKEWIVPVYWSLAIEFQYYLVMALIFPFLFSHKAYLRRLTMALCLLSPFLITFRGSLFAYTGLFMLGISLCQLKLKVLPRPEFILWLLLSALCSWHFVGGVQTIVGLATILLIAFVRIKSPLASFLGTISYSLYLTHDTAGQFIKRILWYKLFKGCFMGEFITLFFALIFSIAVAWLFYLVVEKPSSRLASSLSYQHSFFHNRCPVKVV